MINTVLLSSVYFPDTEYFSALIKSDKAYIDLSENYKRQTYRNRCKILTCNGVLPLVVPVKRSAGKQINNIEIDYSVNWQRIHIHAIVSAYGKAPFFQFYADSLLNILKMKFKHLHELNLKILSELVNLLGIQTEIISLTDFHEIIKENLPDRRLTGKTGIKSFNVENFGSYIQVFSDRFSFIPNLSIIDLLFNLGPDSLMYLEKQIQDLSSSELKSES